jgi:hypothetical protein
LKTNHLGAAASATGEGSGHPCPIGTGGFVAAKIGQNVTQ